MEIPLPEIEEQQQKTTAEGSAQEPPQPQLFTAIESSLTSWFSQLKATTESTVNKVASSEYTSTAQEYASKIQSAVKEGTERVVQEGKQLVDTKKIGGYLDELDKELEVVEKKALGVFTKVGDFLGGEVEERELMDEEIDEGEGKLLFNVDNETPEKTKEDEEEPVSAASTDKSDDVVVVERDLESLKEKYIELYEQWKSLKEFVEFKDTVELSAVDEKVFALIEGMKKEEFVKVLAFKKEIEKKKNDTPVDDAAAADDDDDDDDWE